MRSMSYCTVANVRSIIDTDITDPEITNIITWGDDWVDKKVNSGAATAVFLENLCATYVAYRCVLKDPDALRLGELSTDYGSTKDRIKAELDELLSLAGLGMAFTAASESLA